MAFARCINGQGHNELPKGEGGRGRPPYRQVEAKACGYQNSRHFASKTGKNFFRKDSKMEQRRPNRLIEATSPYLRQHAYNPVEWYPWGAEALGRARREDRPIFLSIGYSTCHWCHVMAHESFENPAVAAIMNEHFINIKVDREERPDLDETYMNAVTALTGHGGWPLSVFLTPELKPFYGGTYFPPEDRGGLPGLPRLLLALSQAYRQNKEQLEGLAEKLLSHLQRFGEVTGPGSKPTREAVTEAAQQLLHEFDPVNGGLGNAPKFPRSLELDFLYHYFRLTGDRQVLDHLGLTLAKMARGGIYDQVGGGFHRYSVDAAWVVPHFEKMLYDNALLAPLYLAEYQLTSNAMARRVATETLDFLLRDLAAPQGGFYAAWDADSEGVEGKFYVWEAAEVQQAAGAEAWPLVSAALGVTQAGNFEGKNILTRPWSREELAERFGLTPEQTGQTLEAALGRLRQIRTRRVPPHRDEKIIVSWNGLAIAALALGAQVLGEARYGQAAAQAARFIWEEVVKDGQLCRIWAAGQASIPAFAEDYALLAYGLLTLYEVDFDPGWIVQARHLLELLEQKFLDEGDGTFLYVARDQETPLVRSKSIYDQTLPSANSMAARVSLKMYRITEEEPFKERALAILERFLGQARGNPLAFAHLWTAAALYVLPELDLTMVGDPAAPMMQEMTRAVYRHYLPERRVLLKDPAASAALEAVAPAARSYSSPDGRPVAYLCHNFACQPPIDNPAELEAKLAQAKPV
jgi:uncharacterized protein